ncbi:MAG: phage terminase small subunit P27 family [Deltaproteobacteria bacterium]|nr:phage terminase small subunit P27 family [Deltaproteobacteria bacterium]
MGAPPGTNNGGGNRRTPTRMLKAQGSALATAKPDFHDPKIPDLMECPAFLQGVAREMWPDVARVLKPLGLATELDEAGLTMLVDGIVDYLESRMLYHKYPRFGKNRHGEMVEHPAVKQFDRSWKRLGGILREFGMTPSARAGLSLNLSFPMKDATPDAGPEKKSRLFAD